MIRRIVPIAVMLFLCATGGAFADIYIGASYLDTSTKFSSSTEDFNTSNGGYKAFIGWNFVRFFGLEATYRDMGSQDESSGSDSVKADLKGYDLSARGILPLGKIINLFAKAGYVDVQVNGSLDSGSTPEDLNSSDWKVYYGAGIEFNFGKHISLRGEYEDFQVDQTLTSASAGILFRF